MKNKVIAIWFILFFSVTTVFAQFAGGDGSEGDPFQVSNPTELDSVRNYKDSCFIQTADIDMNIAPYNSGLGWGPIGTSSALNQFKGQYDGNNFIIRNLYISRDDESDIGMFGYCNGSILKDITLEDVNILGYSNVGALVGNNNNFSSLVNCRMSGSVSGGVRVGGLVGRSYNYCNLTRCSSSGTVHADGQVGGLMGTCGMYCVVSECFSTSQTSTTGSYAGGLINGFSDYCQMDNCYATGDVLGNNFDIGGLLGGIAASSTVENCYSTGRVTGFAGYIGGLIPSNNSSTVLQSYWDTETSELVVSSDGEGKTTAEMMVEGTYVNWDFSTPVWNIHPLINGGYPFLDWQGLSPFPGGDGTVENPYQISNPEELNEVRNYPDAYFIQTADIDLGVAPWNEGTGWLPICDNTNMFTGNYNGDHYFINNLTINRPSDQNVGLFGYASESELYNINIENCNITGDMTIGALAGYHRYNSTISDCYSTGVINGSSFVGGLVGYHFNNATINSSYSTCEINVTTAQSGGLVGYSDIADIYDSYAMGAVNGNNFAGGLVGYIIDSQLSNTYSSGAVSGISNLGGLTGYSNSSTTLDSFWDIETSLLDSSASGTGKTTVEMHAQSTYTNWDFATPVWYIYSSLNSGYPYLEWQPLYPFGYPRNVITEIIGTDIKISWDAVTDAVSYKVFTAEEPYGAFTDVSGSGVFNGESWTIPYSESKKFYYVIAVDGGK